MKFKILIAVVVIAGLLAGVVPVLAATNSHSNGSVATSPVNGNYIMKEEEMQGWPNASDVPSAALQDLPSDSGAQTPTENNANTNNRWWKQWRANRQSKQESNHPWVGLRSGVVTAILRDDGGDITQITMLNRHAVLRAFKITQDTEFYYEKDIPQELAEGSLVTVVCNPVWDITQEAAEQQITAGQVIQEKIEAAREAGYIPSSVLTEAHAVVVHAPRPAIIYGQVSDIDTGAQTLTITTSDGDVKVDTNNDTKYVFLPRPCTVTADESTDADGNTQSIAKLKGFADLQVGDKLVVYAPNTAQEGTRTAKFVAVLPRGELQIVTGTIASIDPGNQTITINQSTVAPGTQIAVKYDSSTIVVLRGEPALEAGDQVCAWCLKDSQGIVTAVTIREILAN